MKTEITLTIDPTDANQVAAALALFQKLSGPELPAVLPVEIPKVEKKVKAPVVEKTQPIVEEIAEEIAEEITAPTIVTPPVAQTTTAVKIEDVRAMLAKKVADHRQVIKDQLTSYGAPNVSTMDASKYGEFMDFLTALK